MIEVDREKAAVYGITVDQVRQELFNAFGSRQVATIYTQTNDYQVILETQARVPQRSVEALQHLHQDQRQRRGAAVGRHAGTAGAGSGITGTGIPAGTSIPLTARDQAGDQRRSASGQPPGPAAVGDDLVQPRARHVDRPGDRRDPAARAGFELAGLDHHRLPGHHAGVRGVAEGPVRPDPGRDLRGLRRARHSLRELHPPDHHHLRPAFGRHRRAADADAVPDGAVGDRDDRHRHAGRHRQEERDHDGRFRDRAAPRRLVRRGRRSARPACCASVRS